MLAVRKYVGIREVVQLVDDGGWGKYVGVREVVQLVGDGGWVKLGPSPRRQRLLFA